MTDSNNRHRFVSYGFDHALFLFTWWCKARASNPSCSYRTGRQGILLLFIYLFFLLRCCCCRRTKMTLHHIRACVALRGLQAHAYASAECRVVSAAASRCVCFLRGIRGRETGASAAARVLLVAADKTVFRRAPPRACALVLGRGPSPHKGRVFVFFCLFLFFLSFFCF